MNSNIFKQVTVICNFAGYPVLISPGVAWWISKLCLAGERKLPKLRAFLKQVMGLRVLNIWSASLVVAMLSGILRMYFMLRRASLGFQVVLNKTGALIINFGLRIFVRRSLREGTVWSRSL